MLTLLLHIVFQTLYYHSTLIQVQHVLMEDALYIPYVGISTACGHACTRYEVYKVRAIYWHFQTCYFNFVIIQVPSSSVVDALFTAQVPLSLVVDAPSTAQSASYPVVDTLSTSQVSSSPVADALSNSQVPSSPVIDALSNV